MRGQLGLGTLLPRQAARRRAGAEDPAAAAARASAASGEPISRAWSFSAVTRARAGDSGAIESGAGSRLGRPRPLRDEAGAGPLPATSMRTSAASRAHGISRPGAAAGTGTVPGASSRTAALRYAAWNWPITPNPAEAASTDLEQVFATWSRTPEAPLLAECGIAFDVIEADAASGRTALIRLDRLGVQLGPVLVAPRGGGRPRGTAARISFLVRVDTAAALSPLIDPRTGPVLLGRGDHVELPRTLDQQQPQPYRATAPIEPFWLRAPSAARPALPAAHVVLGALALAPHRALAGATAMR